MKGNICWILLKQSFACIPYPCPVLVWQWHHIWSFLLHPPAPPGHWRSSSSYPSPEETGPHGSLGKLLHLRSPVKHRFYSKKNGWMKEDFMLIVCVALWHSDSSTATQVWDIIPYQTQPIFEITMFLMCKFTDLPRVSGAPSPFCVRKEGALCGTKPGRWSTTSGPVASPLPPAGPGTAGSAPVKSWKQNTPLHVSASLFCVAAQLT